MFFVIKFSGPNSPIVFVVRDKEWNEYMSESANAPEPEERILYRTTLHWAVLLGPAMLFIIGGLSVRPRMILALIMIGLAVIWGLFCIRNLRTSEFVLTESKLVIRIGFLLKRFYEIPYTKLANADFVKPALGVMMGFGKVMILRKDNKTIAFRLVAKPDELAEKLKKEIIRAHEALNAADTASP